MNEYAVIYWERRWDGSGFFTNLGKNQDKPPSEFSRKNKRAGCSSNPFFFLLINYI